MISAHQRRRLRRLWLERLASAADRQGTHCLAQSIGGQWHYCVLGVACEVYHHFISPLPIVERGRVRYYDGEFCSLPLAVFAALGLTCSQEALMALNDRKRLTFPQIAELIRVRWRRVFTS